MKKEDIKISSIYAMKIGKNTVGIRIMSQNPDGHWVGVNVNTNKEVIIKSADRLCGLYHAKPNRAAKGEKTATEPSNDETSKKERTSSKPGGLSAAVRVLQEAGEPLNCQEMIKRMLEKGYWKTDGKTPSATIYSAITREIKEKGADARFRKTERGKFELVK
ncbi:MAG: winged helix-turn-helix domain-containing protein [Sedimentisphaerales bacterium]